MATLDSYLQAQIAHGATHFVLESDREIVFVLGAGNNAAEAIALGLSEVLREAEIRMLPVADGGEGTAEAICG